MHGHRSGGKSALFGNLPGRDSCSGVCGPDCRKKISGGH